MKLGELIQTMNSNRFLIIRKFFFEFFVFFIVIYCNLLNYK